MLELMELAQFGWLKLGGKSLSLSSSSGFGIGLNPPPIYWSLDFLWYQVDTRWGRWAYLGMLNLNFGVVV
jgi:hypothetical protein